MKLYWIREQPYTNPPLLLEEATVVKETEQMYILDGTSASKWLRRINKNERAYKGFFETSEAAWQAFLENAKGNVAIAERKLENAQEHLRKVIAMMEVSNVQR